MRIIPLLLIIKPVYENCSGQKETKVHGSD
ncbi:hypothetical protein BH20CHL1_BH20CHL1_03500 [soil metagenome]